MIQFRADNVPYWTVAYCTATDPRTLCRADLNLRYTQACDLAIHLRETTGQDYWAVPNRAAELDGYVSGSDVGHTWTDDNELLPLVDDGDLPFPLLPATDWPVTDGLYPEKLGPPTALNALLRDPRWLRMGYDTLRFRSTSGYDITITLAMGRLHLDLVHNGEIIERRAGAPEAMASLAYTWLPLYLPDLDQVGVTR
jgi:hypothetical protein